MLSKLKNNFFFWLIKNRENENTLRTIQGFKRKEKVFTNSVVLIKKMLN